MLLTLLVPAATFESVRVMREGRQDQDDAAWVLYRGVTRAKASTSTIYGSVTSLLHGMIVGDRNGVLCFGSDVSRSF